MKEKRSEGGARLEGKTRPWPDPREPKGLAGGGRVDAVGPPWDARGFGLTRAEPKLMPIGSKVAAFAPATVANVGCGFDVFGFAIEGPGDTVVARRVQQPGLRIVEITGDAGRLPLDPVQNTAGAAAVAVLGTAGLAPGIGVGIELALHKGLPLSSGLGSSAASAVASTVAVQRLLGVDLDPTALLECVLAGERAASGECVHADNAAASLLGGFVLVRKGAPPMSLPVPPGLHCALVHPQIEVQTKASRAALPKTVSIEDAVRQSADVGAFVAAMHAGDLDLLASTLCDRIATPSRKAGLPAFDFACESALSAGAIGAGISGSGPSIFALTRSATSAQETAQAMAHAISSKVGPASHVFSSPVGSAGGRVVEIESP